MSVELNTGISSPSLDFPQTEKKEEAQSAPSSPSSSGACGLEKKAAEADLQPNIRDLKAPQTSVYKRLRYEVSLAYTQAGSGSWWTKIEPLNIYLGALPLKNKGHLEQIADLGVKRVLSLVEDFELEDGYLNTPVKAADWEKKGIATAQIKAVDFLPLTQSEIKSGVEALAQALKDNHTVYVHCKAGRGRSATIVIAYLMQHQMLTFDEAFSCVKNLRPQINLNPDQRQAILDYFANDQLSPEEEAAAKTWTESYFNQEKLTQVLAHMLDYVIDGGSYALGQHAPEVLSGWMPSIKAESTLSRRNRYLREYAGNQEAAAEAAIARNHSYTRRAKIFAAGFLPLVGAPTSYSISLWHQLREIALIAAIHGHDIHDPKVKMKILSALVGGNLLKIPAASVDLIARQIVKRVLIQAGIHGLVPGIPAHLIFNFFTDNAAKVSTHAKTLFAGENTIPVPLNEYSELEDGSNIL